MFDPMTIPAAPLPDATQGTGAIAPVSAPPPVPPAILFQKPTPKPNKNTWDKSIVQKAQGIYPAEAQAKSNQMAQAKLPTPSGPWGQPQ
jgi:hypothetical protein